MVDTGNETFGRNEKLAEQSSIGLTETYRRHSPLNTANNDRYLRRTPMTTHAGGGGATTDDGDLPYNEINNRLSRMECQYAPNKNLDLKHYARTHNNLKPITKNGKGDAVSGENPGKTIEKGTACKQSFNLDGVLRYWEDAPQNPTNKPYSTTQINPSFEQSSQPNPHSPETVMNKPLINPQKVNMALPEEQNSDLLQTKKKYRNQKRFANKQRIFNKPHIPRVSMAQVERQLAGLQLEYQQRQSNAVQRKQLQQAQNNQHTSAPSWRVSALAHAPVPATVSCTHYFTHPPNRPPPFDTSHMHQIGVTLKDAQVVLEVSDASAEGVSTRDPRRAHPDMPCLPFVLMAEKPVLAGLNLETSRVEENETGNGNQETQYVASNGWIEKAHKDWKREQIRITESNMSTDPNTEDAREHQVPASPQIPPLFLNHSISSESSSNDEGLSYVDFQHEYRSSNGKYDRNESMDNLFESEQLIHMKSYMPTPAIQSTETELFESARSSIHGSPIKKDISQYVTKLRGQNHPANIEVRSTELFSMDISPTWSPITASSDEAKPSDILDAALLRLAGESNDVPWITTIEEWNAARENRFTRPTSDPNSDGSLDDIPELQTPSSSESSSRSPSPAHVTNGSNSLLLKEGYVLIPTVDIVHEAGELRRYAPTPDWKGHYVGIKDYVDMKQEGARRKEVWEDDMTGHMGEQVVTALRDRLGHMLDHHAMEKGEEELDSRSSKPSMPLGLHPTRAFGAFRLRHSWKSDIHEKSLPPLPFLNGEENAKLRLVRHTFEKNGNGHIAQIAKRILEFQFAEPQVILHLLHAGLLDKADTYPGSRNQGELHDGAAHSDDKYFRAYQPPSSKPSGHHAGGAMPGPTAGDCGLHAERREYALDGEHPFTTSDGGGPTVTMGIHCQTGAASLKRKRDCLGRINSCEQMDTIEEEGNISASLSY
ncbi:hypothetical protein K438DRAFT_1788142 [Mycena galopus ATCC 62051]|nr:hypothetical protein K438DRAFT_1788142 [Mycena galopus ATCC 62051]